MAADTMANRTLLLALTAAALFVGVSAADRQAEAVVAQQGQQDAFAGLANGQDAGHAAKVCSACTDTRTRTQAARRDFEDRIAKFY